MENNIRIEALPENKYHTIFWVEKGIFDAMLAMLESGYKEMRKKGGKKRKLSVLDMLVVFFAYYHDYRTMENIAFDYLCHKQRICEAIAWVEKTLVKDGTFALPSKRKLVNAETDIVIAIVDATECETERPKKTKRKLLREAEMPHKGSVADDTKKSDEEAGKNITIRDTSGTLIAKAGAAKHESDWESLILSSCYGFCPDNSVTAGNIGMEYEKTATLSVTKKMGVCHVLNDQGGERIGISEDIVSTLRAEAHGNIPCVVENHPQTDV